MTGEMKHEAFHPFIGFVPCGVYWTEYADIRSLHADD
jgi:hypothetical protein